ncbi:MAG: MgtC/SapB family protein [Anaerolineae bacterium]|uniref:MgtC/SapB family protein n=1 Tax=Promineifilum sp. TaxID=2664178 RepID=UPI001DC9C66A|nr:MgtC/SapB family protein [Anaerolineales bacterium]MCB8936079.1 MgtC/SapB family protein [Promineifilum sp.]MCO5181699.1 MgtC/SapB family protein [Promineifilum sp.]MCW5847806.1 MgtC/SapB family protein [Anaerolineae bacterium]
MDWQMQLIWAGRLALAAVLGAIIGYERERRGRSAGLRTFAAVSLGSCLFSIVSYVVVPGGNETTRIAAQIVTGVGFLGAGVILHGQNQGHISGLTTSATLWAAAAVGMAVGYNLLILAVAATLLLMLLLLLRLIPGLERHAPDENSTHDPGD